MLNLQACVWRTRCWRWLAIPMLCMSLQVYAQNNVPDVSISVDVNGSLAELLEAIAKKGGVRFSYNPKKIEAEQSTKYTAVNKKLPAVLNDLADRFGIRYTLVEGQIILKPEKKIEKAGIQTVTLSGTIKDAGSGEALIGASVLFKELQTGTVTNAFGFFSITVPKGKYTISSSFLGYEERTTTVELGASIQQDIALKEELPVLEEVVVSNALPDVVQEITASNTNVRPKSVEERPALFGEVDVVKSLESLPGVKLHSDGSTFYYVRGGNRDENLVLLDDAPIYNPSHMLGLFSTIIPDAVNDITLYKGDMPASLGGRLSSVLDVRTKKGNDQRFEAWGSTGLITTKVGVEGPFRKSASSFLVSARASTLKWIFQRINNDVKQFDFYDFTTKVNVKINPENRILFSLYTGADHYFDSNNGLTWSNTAGTLRWNHLFSDRLFMNTTVAIAGYDYFLYTDVATNTRWNSHISNFNVKSDFSYFIRPENELTFGLGVNGYTFNPGNLQSDTTISFLPTLSVRNSVELVLYGNHEVKLNDRWGVNYGLRFSVWSNTGEAFEYVFDENHNPVDTLYYAKGDDYKQFVNLEPRLTLSYMLNDHASLKASYARNVQNVHLISNSISPFTSLEVWLPSSINIKPEKADQVTLGYYRSWQDIGTSFTAETFYKKMYNQIDYNAHAETLLNPLLERELRFGQATAYGIELLAKKDEGRLRGWVGYTYSRAQRKFADINGGKVYNAFYDRPHQVNIMVAYDLSLRWNLGMNWVYSTGSPFSSPVSFYQYNGEEVPIYGQKNNDRLPDYHRLDLSATVKLNKNPEKRFRHSLSFSIFNVYGRKNALFVNYNKTENSNGDFKIPSDVSDGNRVTSQYYLFRFTPSIAYNFRWL
ncbi:MAG TPA: TonB-dependent receptor [Ohtaekwangia sp.]|uniref:TonB-dependent receptor n=1 Tax=Ohtaekwangia sp. TaxID=2066019 RepID=UPI002F95BBF7